MIDPRRGADRSRRRATVSGVVGWALVAGAAALVVLMLATRQLVLGAYGVALAGCALGVFARATAHDLAAHVEDQWADFAAQLRDGTRR